MPAKNPGNGLAIPHGNPHADACHRWTPPLTLLLLTLGWTAGAAPLVDSFAAYPDAPVTCLALQADGKVLAGGRFATVTELPRAGLVRLGEDGGVDAGFNPSFNGEVDALLILPEGDLVVGGTFARVNSTPWSRLARLHPDGSLDATFSPTIAGTVSALALQPDGLLIVGGTFTSVAGVPRTHLARLRPDGSIDPSFAPNPNGQIKSLALQPDGSILAGGTFLAIGGGLQGYLARLHPDGTLDPTFRPALTPPPLAIAQEPTGSILIAGGFTQVSGLPHHRLARLTREGTADPGFRPDFDALVYSVALQVDGRILVGGAFTQVNGHPQSGIARLLPDGSLDPANPEGINGTGYVVTLDARGNILTGGSFYRVGSQTEYRFNLIRFSNDTSPQEALTVRSQAVQWHRDGGLPECWRTTLERLEEGANWRLLASGSRIAGGWAFAGPAIPDGSSLRLRGYVDGGQSGSGWFVEDYYGSPVVVEQPKPVTVDAGSDARFQVRIAPTQSATYRWLKDGTAMQDGPGISGVHEASLHLLGVLGGDAGEYQVAVSSGSETTLSTRALLTVHDPALSSPPAPARGDVGGEVTLGVSAVGTSLTFQWLKEGIPVPGADNATLALKPLTPADAGHYQVEVTSRYGKVTSPPALLRVNQALLDPEFQVTQPLTPQTIALQPDSKVLIGGSLHNGSGTTTAGLLRINPDGSVDPQFQSQVDPAPGLDYALVSQVVVQRDGRILVGGFFGGVNGLPVLHLARLTPDGQLDPAFHPQPDGMVRTIVPLLDGRMIVTGEFLRIDGRFIPYLARLGPDGSVDPSFTAGPDSRIFVAALQPDGKLLIGGEFHQIRSRNQPFLARLNPDGSPDGTFHPILVNPVYTLLLQPDGDIVVESSPTPYLMGGGVMRFHSDGTLDTGFQVSIGSPSPLGSLLLQADGGIILGGSLVSIQGEPQSSLARIRGDGTLDTAFSPPSMSVWGVSLQPDGGLLVGDADNFPGLVRLTPSLQAVSRLVLDGSTVRWERDGGAPELRDVTFELSADGTTWGAPVIARKTPGGWEAQGVPLSPQVRIRATGWGVGSPVEVGGLVAAYFGPPFVITPPRGESLDAGSSTLLSAVIAGTGPLSFQWRHNGSPLIDGPTVQGSMTSTLRLTGLLGADAGNYTLEVTAPGGTLLTEPVSLEVRDPVIVEQPGSLNLAPKSDALLSVRTAGSPAGFQWRKDGTPLAAPTANTSTLRLQDVPTGMPGRYSVVVTTAYGSATSQVALVTVDTSHQDLQFLPSAVIGRLQPVEAVEPDGRLLTLSGPSLIRRIQTNGAPDSSFRTTGSFDSVLGDILLAIDPEGGVLAGGSFKWTSNSGSIRTNLVRFHPDGTLDDSFAPPLNGVVHSIQIQPDGSILVAGIFVRPHPGPVYYLARFYPDGSEDPLFNPAVGGNALTLMLQPDGRILVGGDLFPEVPGTVHPGLVRLFPDGRLDPSLKSGLPPDESPALALQPDGAILVGTQTLRAAQDPHPYLTRLHPDGSVDTGFNPAADGPILSLALQADGGILVGGRFHVIGGALRAGFARLMPDGYADTHLSPPARSFELLEPGGTLLFDETIWPPDLEYYFRQRVRVAGTGEPTHQVRHEGVSIRWERGGTSPQVRSAWFESSLDGLHWSFLGIGTAVTGGWELAPILLPPHAHFRARGYAIAGGGGSDWFVEDFGGPPVVGGLPQLTSRNAGDSVSFSARVLGTGPFEYQWRKDGGLLRDDAHTLGATRETLTLTGLGGADSGSYTLEVSNAEGRMESLPATLTVADPVILQGPSDQFANVGGTFTLSVVAAGTDLRYEWLKNNVRLVPPAHGPTLVVGPLRPTDAGDYTVTVTSPFSSVTPPPAHVGVNLAMPDPDFSPNTRSRVDALAIGPGGTLFVGSSATPDGPLEPNIRRLLPGGAPDERFHPAYGCPPSALALQEDGQLLIGGVFIRVNGFTRENLARLDTTGAFDATFTPSSGGRISTLLVEADGTLLLAGDLESLPQVPRSGVARLSPTGTLLPKPLPIPVGATEALVRAPDGSLIAAGYIPPFPSANYLLSLIQPGNLATPLATLLTGTEGPLGGLLVQPDGNILVSGAFPPPGAGPDSQIPLLLRLSPGGIVDRGFGGPAALASDVPLAADFSKWQKVPMALQCDGSLIIATPQYASGDSRGTLLERRRPDGSRDDTFAARIAGRVNVLVIEEDGSVLLGGDFEAAADEPHRNLARIRNPSPATRSLVRTATGLRWDRGGASPEVWRTTFAQTLNGIDWLPLGQGRRTPEGWVVEAGALPPEATIRARGYLSGGSPGSAGGFVESYDGPPLFLLNPVDRMAIEGSPVSLEARAEGTPPLSFHWLRGGVPLEDGPGTSGSHSPTLTLAHLSRLEAGEYSLRVDGPAGSRTSTVAHLTVLEPPVGDLVVTTTADAGPGSLRESMLLANLHPGPDRITFAIPGEGPWVLRPRTPLPAITDRLAIDATTQPGFAGIPVIGIDGGGVNLDGANALELLASGSEVRGLSIYAFQGNAIVVAAPECVIQGCRLGLDLSGVGGAPPQLTGVLLLSSGNRVGGAEPGAGNTISWSSSSAIRIAGPDATRNRILGNTVGPTPSGSTFIGNTVGIDIDGGVGNQIGGDSPTERNIISRSGLFGVWIRHGASSNVISGNYIGVRSDGITPDANGVAGVFVLDGTANRIANGNVISGNGQAGVLVGTYSSLYTGTPSGTEVLGNYLGPASNGSRVNSDQFDGIVIGPGATNTVITAGNVISGNLLSGIRVMGNTRDTRITRNVIGLDPTGQHPLPNLAGGILFGGGPAPESVRIGETQAPNIISGNVGVGIGLYTYGSNSVIEGNIIGSDATLQLPLGNEGPGIVISNEGSPGGSTPPLRVIENEIAHNHGAGVLLYDAAARPDLHVTGVSIWRDAIYGNTGPAIQLSRSTPLPNDPLDWDVGPNGLQNHPVLASAIFDTAGILQVEGLLSSQPGKSYLIHLYLTDRPDAWGRGQPRVWIGTATAFTSATGDGSFSVELRIHAPIDLWRFPLLCATATDSDGSTSELSPCISILPRASAPILVGFSGDLTLHAGETGSLEVFALGVAPIAYQWEVNGLPIEGADGSSLRLSGVTLADAGTYTVEVSTAGGPLRVPPFRVTVLVPGDSDGDGMDDDWERAHGLDPGNRADGSEDSDHDGLTNLEEYRAGTDPHDPASRLWVEVTRGDHPADPLRLRFEAQPGRAYSVESRSGDPGIGSSPWVEVARIPAVESRQIINLILSRSTDRALHLYRVTTRGKP